jgi:4-amino-4-deoxychorismate lyase
LLVNGESGTHIPASDRGLQYGDGLFETIAVVDSHPCLWERHYERLEVGGSRLGIPIPAPDILLKEVLQEIGYREKGVIKIIISRGEGKRGYAPPKPAVSTRVVEFSPWPEYSTEANSNGVKVRVCSTRLGANPLLAGIKHLNRLEQVMARSEWNDSDIKEGLMLDASGRVIEGTMSNIFIEKEGIMHTPDLTDCGVNGVMRSLVLDVAKDQGTKVNIGHITLSEVLHADNLMLTNSIFGIWPVAQLEEREYELSQLNQKLIAEVFNRAYV